jgi:hypothetical protein
MFDCCPQGAVSYYDMQLTPCYPFFFIEKNAMLSIIDQVAGKEEERTQKKNAQMVSLTL